MESLIAKILRLTSAKQAAAWSVVLVLIGWGLRAALNVSNMDTSRSALDALAFAAPPAATLAVLAVALIVGTMMIVWSRLRSIGDRDTVLCTALAGSLQCLTWVHIFLERTMPVRLPEDGLAGEALYGAYSFIGFFLGISLLFVLARITGPAKEPDPT